VNKSSKCESATPFAPRKSKSAGQNSAPCFRLSQIAAPRQILVRLCQLTNFGEIRDIEVRHGEPVFGSASQVLVDLRLDANEAPRAETRLLDFDLCQEFCRLLLQLDRIENGRIARIEIRAGLPRRILFESHVGRMSA
jgi:hypothetical protein